MAGAAAGTAQGIAVAVDELKKRKEKKYFYQILDVGTESSLKSHHNFPRPFTFKTHQSSKSKTTFEVLTKTKSNSQHSHSYRAKNKINKHFHNIKVPIGRRLD